MATLLLVIIYVAFISLGLPDALLGAGWPAMRLSLGVPVGYAGILQMITSAGTILSSINSGRILAKYGTGRVTAVSVAMTAAALFGFACIPSFWWLILAAIPLGLGAGSVDSGLNAFVAEHYESRHMSWLHSFWGIGALSGPLVLSFFLARGASWRSGYLSIAIFQCVLVAVLFIALPLWAKVHARTYGDEGAPDVVHPGLPEILKIRGVKFAVVTFLFYCGIEASTGLWSGSYLVQIKGLEPSAAARWVSAFYASITAGRILTGFVTFKIRNADLIRWGSVLILAGVGLMLIPAPFAVTVAGIILTGLGCAPIFPCMLHETPVRFGSKYAQSIMGVQMAFAYIGTTLLPPLFGMVSSFTTLALLPLFLLVYILVLLTASERLRPVRAAL